MTTKLWVSLAIFTLATATTHTASSDEHPSWSHLHPGPSWHAPHSGQGVAMDLIPLLVQQSKNHTALPLEGMAILPGPHSAAPAVHFHGAWPRHASLRASSHPWLAKSLHSLVSGAEEVALLASVRQRRGNVGTLLMLTAEDSQETSLLELQSSGRSHALRLHYYTSSSQAVSSSASPSSSVVSIPMELADDTWHRLAVIVSGKQIQVFLDCSSVFKRQLSLPLDFRLSQNLTLWLGQHSTKKQFLYKGYLQDVRLVTGDPDAHLLQCPKAEAAPCPTCGQFQAMQAALQRLEERHQEEMKIVKERLAAAESRLDEVEKCDCPKSCRAPGGLIREDGASWHEGCQLCSCVRGEIICREPTCPALNCTDPRPPDPEQGLCCPTCRAECLLYGKRVPHGQSESLRIPHGQSESLHRCGSCGCRDGNLTCVITESEADCPRLDCPASEQIREEGKCCKVCKGSDHCSATPHDCLPDAVCVNGLFNYTCRCKDGFVGDGRTECRDIDECSSEAEFGHLCDSDGHTQCVNTHGSYLCQCLEGFVRSPRTGKCVPRDLCSEGSHDCHGNATCVFRGPNQYDCVCDTGYHGDGRLCEAVCQGGCDNGGACVAPGLCQCPRGFSGPHCQEDIDECALGEEVHGCGANSRCVNQPGWHYCQCVAGFRSYHDPLRSQPVCIDIDECSLGTHTCPRTTTCVNSEGSYRCECRGDSCSRECLVEGQLKTDGSAWPSPDTCETCECSHGHVSCSPVTCDCAQPSACCPQCRRDLGALETGLCVHETDSGLFRHYEAGERWIHKCQECECLNGEIDCWPLPCPPVLLGPHHCPPNATTSSGSSCCQSPTSSCLKLSETASPSGPCKPDDLDCLFEGARYANGERFSPLKSRCSSCQCKVPYCDLLVSSSNSSSSPLIRSMMSSACKSLAVASASVLVTAGWLCLLQHGPGL